MRLQDIAARRTDLFHLKPEDLSVQEGFNVRVSGPGLDEHIRVLANSLKEIGVQTPLTVRVDGDKVYLVDGHCRLAAIKLAISEGAEIVSVPCIAAPKGSDDAQLTLSLITRNGGRPLEPLEKASVFARLLAFGWSEELIGQRAGIGCKQVKNLLDLAAAPAEIKEMVAKNEVSATTAVRTMQQAPSKAAAVETLTTAVSAAKAEGKTKVTPKAVNRPPTPKAPLPTPAQPKVTTTSPRYSAAQVQVMVETLEEMLTIRDIKIIHNMARQALK